MNNVDIILAIIILIGGISGYREGFLMSLISLIAIILGVLGGFKLMGHAMVLLSGKFNVDTKVLPYIAFGVVFLVIVISVSLIGRAIKASIDNNFLGRADQAAGALIGLLKVVFMLSVIIWIVSSLKLSYHAEWKEHSWLYPKIAMVAPTVTHWIAQLVPFFKNIF